MKDGELYYGGGDTNGGVMEVFDPDAGKVCTAVRSLLGAAGMLYCCGARLGESVELPPIFSFLGGRNRDRNSAHSWTFVCWCGAYMVGSRWQRQWVIEACKELHIMPTTEGGIDTMPDETHFIDGFNNEHSLPTLPLYNDVIQLLVRPRAFETPTLIVAYGRAFGENYFYETTRCSR